MKSLNSKNSQQIKRFEKLKKDIHEWVMDKSYPYLIPDHYTNRPVRNWGNQRGRCVGRGGNRNYQQKRHVTFSNSSYSNSTGSEEDERPGRELAHSSSEGPNYGFLFRRNQNQQGAQQHRVTRSQYQGKMRGQL